MSMLANFLQAIAQILDTILYLIIILILVRALISWVNPDPYNPIVQFLRRSTDPLLKPFRKILPPWRTGGIDFSPFMATLVLVFLKIFIVQSLLDYVFRLRGGRGFL